MASKSAGATAASGSPPALAPEQADAIRQIEAAADAAAQRLIAAIDLWFFEHIHNSPVSVATEAYTHLHGRLDALKAAVINASKEA